MYIPLPMYEDGVTTNSTFDLCVTTLRQVSLSILHTALTHDGIPYTTELKTQRVRVPFTHWKAVRKTVERCKWELHESSTPLFVLELLDYYVKKRRVVSMEEIRDRITPLIFDSLRPYQQTMVQIAVERNDIHVADEMGTGKTFIALSVARYWNEPTLIITLPNILLKWYDETMNRMDWTSDQVVVCKSSSKVIKCDVDGLLWYLEKPSR